MKDTIKLTFPKKKETQSKIIIEAAHVYTNEHPDLEHQLSAQLAAVLGQCLTQVGWDVENWLFVDNYNPLYEDKPIVFDEDTYIDQLVAWNFEPHNIVYEADLTQQAKQILKCLQKKGYTTTNHKGIEVLQKGKVPLYNPANNKYMCSLLDACLYLEKVKQADETVVVLDEKYKIQQKGAITVLKKLAVDTSTIHQLYYSSAAAPPNKQSQPSIKSVIDLVQIVTSLGGAISTKQGNQVEVTLYGI